MEKEELLRVLETNEITDICGGGYWITERINGVITTFWVER